MAKYKVDITGINTSEIEVYLEQAVLELKESQKDKVA